MDLVSCDLQDNYIQKWLNGAHCSRGASFDFYKKCKVLTVIGNGNEIEDIIMEDRWFQQDGATWHKLNTTINILL